MHKSSSTCVTAKHASVTNQTPEEYNTKEDQFLLFKWNVSPMKL